MGGETGAYFGILIDIDLVVVIDESVGKRLAENQPDERHQRDDNENARALGAMVAAGLERFCHSTGKIDIEAQTLPQT